jgi:hypothetical protein
MGLYFFVGPIYQPPHSTTCARLALPCTCAPPPPYASAHAPTPGNTPQLSVSPAAGLCAVRGRLCPCSAALGVPALTLHQETPHTRH